MNLLFEKNKLKQKLKKDGKPFELKTTNKNEFGESGAQESTVCTILGLFHTSKSFVTKTGSEGAIQTSVPQPMILCSWDDVKDVVKPGQYYVDENNNKMYVNGITNIDNLGVYGDISLGVENNGINMGL